MRLQKRLQYSSICPRCMITEPRVSVKLLEFSRIFSIFLCFLTFKFFLAFYKLYHEIKVGCVTYIAGDTTSH